MTGYSTDTVVKGSGWKREIIRYDLVSFIFELVPVSKGAFFVVLKLPVLTKMSF